MTAREFIDNTAGEAQAIYESATDRVVNVNGEGGLFTGERVLMHPQPEVARKSVVVAVLRCDVQKRLADELSTRYLNELGNH